jgi:membrane protease YdiL (CAAX protease family)
VTTAQQEPAPVARWPPPTQRSQQWSVRYALVALVLAELAASAVAWALRRVGVDFPRGVGGLLVEAALLATLVPLYRSGSLRPVDLGLRPVPPGRSVGYAVLGLFAYGWASVLWTRSVHPPPIHRVFAGIADHSTPVIALTGLAAVVGAPVVEEIFFRGFLYRSLRNRMSIAPACLIVGLIFGLGHTQYPLLVRPVLGAFGVIACLLYERTGSLLPGIAMHSYIDASGFEYALTGRINVVIDVFALLALVLLVVGFLKTVSRPRTPDELPSQSTLQRRRSGAVESKAGSGG